MNLISQRERGLEINAVVKINDIVFIFDIYNIPNKTDYVVFASIKQGGYVYSE